MSMFMHFVIFLTGLLLFYLFVFKDENRTDVQNAYKEALDLIEDDLAPMKDVLQPLREPLLAARAEAVAEPEPSYNDYLTYIMTGLIFLFLIVTIVMAGVKKDWKMFGYVILENMYTFLIFMSVLAVAYVLVFKKYEPLLPQNLANEIVETPITS